MGLSAEAAAGRAEIRLSGARWRQIEKGFRGDSQSVVTAPHATLAHMARAVGITSDRLAETGRTEAADILREMERTKAPDTSATVEAAPLTELKDWQQQIILNALDERPRSAREKALLLRTLAAQIEAAAGEPAESPTGRHNEPGRSAS
ncbi:hypothetical protein [Streptomyces murinus]